MLRIMQDQYGSTGDKNNSINNTENRSAVEQAENAKTLIELQSKGSIQQ